MSRRWLLVLPAAFLLLFFVLPLLQVGSAALPLPGRALFTAQDARTALRAAGFTFFQAALSTLLTLLLGLPAAYVLYRVDFPGRALVRVLTAVPFILPTVVVAAGINAYIGPRGWANLLLQRLFALPQPPLHWSGALPAILLAHVFYNLTIVIRMVGTAWSRLPPRLEQAGRMLGADSWQVFRRITLPLLRPVAVSALLLVFLFDFTSFGVILLLGGPRYATLEVEVYRQAMTYFNLPLAGSLSLLQIACCTGVAWLYQLFSTRPVPFVPSGEGKTPGRPASWSAWMLSAFTLLVLLLLIGGPLLSLLGSAFLSPGAGPAQPTLAYFQALSQNARLDYFYVPPLVAVRNSFLFGLLTALCSLLLGMLLVYGLPAGGKAARWVQNLLVLPLGTSAVTLGLGYVLLFNRAPLLWGRWPGLIPMAHTLIALPFVVRTLLPARNSLPASYGQGAALLGASPWQVFRRIDLPLLRRSILSAAVFAFTLSLGEFGATSFLTRPDFPTLPVAIYRYLSLPGELNYGQAMAMSTLLLAVCAGGILVIENAGLGQPGKAAP